MYGTVSVCQEGEKGDSQVPSSSSLARVPALSPAVAFSFCKSDRGLRRNGALSRGQDGKRL